MRALRLLGALAGARARRRFEAGMPRYLTYIVSFTCNARCVMCDSWKKPSPDELTLAEIERIFRQLPALDFVRLSGGEPFARPVLLEIAHLAQDHLRPLRLHVTTNGILTDRIARFCEQRRTRVPLQLLISLDGMEAKHNQVRGRDTAWAAATATLKALAPRRRELRLELAVNQTIVDAEGAADYRRLNAFLRPLGIRHHVVLAYDLSATYSLKAEMDAAPKAIGDFATFGDFRNGQIAALWDEVERDVATWPWPERLAKRYYIRGIRDRVLLGRGSPNPPCVALNAHLRILPNGDVPTCQFNTRKVGNLRQQSFREVWFGAAIGAQRDWVRKCPGCWAECEVLPNAFYTGDLWQHLPADTRSA
ncbi:MAG: radical SAM protein [Verrucomicrobia bacterium]|nr:radical SAM protein [Verrucomicrobiota bacterium]